MGELVRVDALTEKQQAVVDALMAGMEVRDAMTLAGYAESVNPAQVVGSRAVQRAIEASCDAKLRGELRAKALKTMEELLSASTPAATRFQAAKFIAEQTRPADGDDKPLSEMTPDELEAVVRRCQAVIAEGQQPVMIDVTPKNGA